jgi:hypothetical protein
MRPEIFQLALRAQQRLGQRGLVVLLEPIAVELPFGIKPDIRSAVWHLNDSVFSAQEARMARVPSWD